VAERMIIRKHTTGQHNLPDIAKMSNWRAISKVPKLFEQTTYKVLNQSPITVWQGSRFQKFKCCSFFIYIRDTCFISGI
jgi:hypothetical protein